VRSTRKSTSISHRCSGLTGNWPDWGAVLNVVAVVAEVVATDHGPVPIEDIQVVVTEEHPFYVDGEGWVLSGDLQVGDHLAQHNHTTTTIKSITRNQRVVTVYNFEVNTDHNYYITTAKLLAHNCRVKLPPSVVARENGVTTRHNYTSGDHGPPHLHVVGGGRSTRIGQKGKPIDGSSELTAAQRVVVAGNRSRIRSTVKKIGHWYSSTR
jgi:hypothetical protein